MLSRRVLGLRGTKLNITQLHSGNPRPGGTVSAGWPVGGLRGRAQGRPNSARSGRWGSQKSFKSTRFQVSSQHHFGGWIEATQEKGRYVIRQKATVIGMYERAWDTYGWSSEISLHPDSGILNWGLRKSKLSFIKIFLHQLCEWSSIGLGRWEVKES